MNFGSIILMAMASLAIAGPTHDARSAPNCRGPCGDNNSFCKNGLCPGAVGVCKCI